MSEHRSRLVIYALLSWLVALACTGTAWVRARQMGRISLPASSALVQRLRKTDQGDAEGTLMSARAELDELLLEVDRDTRVGAELPRALARVSLASGTALALLALIEHMPSPAWSAVGGAFIGGFVGMFGSSALGRLADTRARAAREHWSTAVRRAYTQLGSGRASNAETG